jgi:hypothetical protein
MIIHSIVRTHNIYSTRMWHACGGTMSGAASPGLLNYI